MLNYIFCVLGTRAGSNESKWLQWNCSQWKACRPQLLVWVQWWASKSMQWNAMTMKGNPKYVICNEMTMISLRQSLQWKWCLQWKLKIYQMFVHCNEHGLGFYPMNLQWNEVGKGRICNENSAMKWFVVKLYT